MSSYSTSEVEGTLSKGFFKNKNSQENSNQSQSKGNNCVSIDGPKVNIVHINFLSSLYDIHKHNVPSSTSEVKYKTLDMEFTPEKLGTIKTVAYHAADRFTDRPESAFKAALLSFEFENNLTNTIEQSHFLLSITRN